MFFFIRPWRILNTTFSTAFRCGVRADLIIMTALGGHRCWSVERVVRAYTRTAAAAPHTHTRTQVRSRVKTNDRLGSSGGGGGIDKTTVHKTRLIPGTHLNIYIYIINLCTYVIYPTFPSPLPRARYHPTTHRRRAVHLVDVHIMYIYLTVVPFLVFFNPSSARRRTTTYIINTYILRIYNIILSYQYGIIYIFVRPCTHGRVFKKTNYNYSSSFTRTYNIIILPTSSLPRLTRSSPPRIVSHSYNDILL